MFPLVGSMTTPPFLSLPSASAVRSMESATRSFALPAGFCRSSLARTLMPGAKRESRTSGVPPMSSVMSEYILAMCRLQM